MRVSFTHIFHRGKIADLVNLLSGRNFETRENIESIAEESFKKLRQGVEAFVNETNFKQVRIAIDRLKTTGIIHFEGSGKGGHWVVSEGELN